MHCKFRAGDRVVLLEDDLASGLKRGAAGVVWTAYAVEPPAYEVTFRDEFGEEFDLTLSETEIASAVPALTTF